MSGPDGALWFTTWDGKIGRFEVNGAPVGGEDAFEIRQGGEATGNVLVNDTDEDEDDLTAVEEEGGGPSSGTLDLQSSGQFTYTPDPDFVGTDHFTYLAYDGTDYSDPITVTITVTQKQPPAKQTDGSVCLTPANNGPIAPDRLSQNLTNEPAKYTTAPVRYNDGVVQIQMTDLESDGFGSPVGTGPELDQRAGICREFV